MVYEVKLEAFQGPLELLYKLVKKNKIEISKISLAKITDQYLEYIDHFQQFDLEMASEFMVIASELIELKAGSLLPDSDEKQEEDEAFEKRSIVERLREYQLFKEISRRLNMYQQESSNIFFRPQSALPEIEKVEQLELEVPPEQLLKALIKVLNSVKEDEKEDKSLTELSYYEKIEDNIRVQDKVKKIRKMIKNRATPVSFFSFIKDRDNRFEIIVTLLSVLELIKMKEVQVLQDGLFSDIKIKSG